MTRDSRRPSFASGSEPSNQATRYFDAAGDPELVDFGALFRDHYAAIREALGGIQQPGVAVVAIDRAAGRLADIAYVAGRVGEAATLIVGRHTRADLRPGDDPAMSLRQLALVVEPLTELARPGRGVCFRVIDLRSQHGLETEEGKTLGGILADGPAFLASGNHAFFFFVTGDPTDWPASSRDAWSFIPERVYLEERRRLARGSARRRAVGRSLARRSMTVVQPTRPAGRLTGEALLCHGEPRLGDLVLASRGAARSIPIGATALEDGVLIGRYERCDAADLLGDPNMSRVHLLVVSIAGVPHAVDTASTNGTSVGGRSIRVQPLTRELTLDLGDAARLTWRPAARGGERR